MRILFLLFVCSIPSLFQAQTAIIAHKSHSGTAVDFFTDPSTNFGIPSRKLIQIVYLNDSTSIRVYSRFDDAFEYDTIRQRMSYSLNIDSVKKESPGLKRIEYVNFKHSADSSRIKKSRQQLQKEQEIQNQEEFIREDAPKKKKKGSALLFIFFVTGGGLLLFRFFNRLLTPQTLS